MKVAKKSALSDRFVKMYRVRGLSRRCDRSGRQPLILQLTAMPIKPNACRTSANMVKVYCIICYFFLAVFSTTKMSFILVIDASYNNSYF